MIIFIKIIFIMTKVPSFYIRSHRLMINILVFYMISTVCTFFIGLLLLPYISYRSVQYRYLIRK